MKKAVIFLATGFEEIEAISIIDVLRRGGIDLDLVSVSGMEFVEGGHGIVVKCDALFFSIDFKDYDLFILPGGMPGTTNLSKHEGLCALLKNANELNKKIGAICAAPTVLAQEGILEGKLATCYPGFEDALTGAKVINQDIVRDGNIITGRGPGVAMLFGLELLKDYLSIEEVKKHKEKLIMRS
jgi:4-methyl-5(b-hydroxyethyl)-thiazole monophosphate biosynthesis